MAKCEKDHSTLGRRKFKITVINVVYTVCAVFSFKIRRCLRRRVLRMQVNQKINIFVEKIYFL